MATATQIGAFPGMNDFRRRTIRAPVNPLDKSTIVSIFPKKIDEIKHTIQPGRFIIEKGSYEEPSLLVVGPSSWWRELDEEQPLLEIPNSSIQIADSVIRDFLAGLLACNMSDVAPGLFFVPGELTVTQVKSLHKDKLDFALGNQKRWFSTLVQLADGLWSGSNGNPLTIGDDMRLAAKELGLNTKEWLQDFQAMETVRCVACGQMRNPLFPICPHCKTVVDADKYKKLGLKQAE